MLGNAASVTASSSQKVRVAMMDFLRTGIFGPLTLGASRESVRKAFGEPDEIPGPVFRHRLPAIWKYGSLEFHFASRGDTLSRINAERFERFDGGMRIELDPWWVGATATLEQARHEFFDTGISFESIESPDNNTLCYRAGAGITLSFQQQSPHRFLGLSFAL